MHVLVVIMLILIIIIMQGNSTAVVNQASVMFFFYNSSTMIILLSPAKVVPCASSTTTATMAPGSGCKTPTTSYLITTPRTHSEEDSICQSPHPPAHSFPILLCSFLRKVPYYH